MAFSAAGLDCFPVTKSVLLVWPAKTGVASSFPTSDADVNTVDFGVCSWESFLSSATGEALPDGLDSFGPKPTKPEETESLPREVILNSVPRTLAVATGDRTLNPTAFPPSLLTEAEIEPQEI